MRVIPGRGLYGGMPKATESGKVLLPAQGGDWLHVEPSELERFPDLLQSTEQAEAFDSALDLTSLEAKKIALQRVEREHNEIAMTEAAKYAQARTRNLRRGAPRERLAQLSDHLLGGSKKKLLEARDRQTPVTKKCAGCGLDFAVVHGAVTYHSPQCAVLQRWNRFVKKNGRPISRGSSPAIAAAEAAGQKLQRHISKCTDCQKKGGHLCRIGEGLFAGDQTAQRFAATHYDPE